MDRESLIYEGILDNMNAGVITVDADGRVSVFNPAASKMLGLPREQVLGQRFGEVFLHQTHLDEFNQCILDAVHEANVQHDRVIHIASGDSERLLWLATSYLQVVADGETRKLGVIGIFNDVTEVRRLREAELELAESVRVQNRELQDAYLKIEERNQALNAMVKRRRVAAVGIVGLFMAAGIYTAEPEFLSVLPWLSDKRPTATVASPAGADRVRTVTARRRRITATVPLSGSLVPHREVNVVSPIRGTVGAILFRYGERVEKGQTLLRLDTVGVQRELRDAQASRIKALRRYNEIKDWGNSAEVARARQSVVRARLALEDRKNALDQSEFLLGKGLISALEHESNQQRYRDQSLTLEAARFDLKNTLARGGPDEVRVARLELDNAEDRLRVLEEEVAQAVITAPISGVVLDAPPGENTGATEKRVTAGRAVSAGEQLLTIGDLDNLSVMGKVDEVDIPRIREGQEVRIVGDAFPGLELRGAVARISSQASPAMRSNAPPSFDVTVTIEHLSHEQRQRLRPGMSADLEVVVYDKPDALTVPVQAVQARGDQAWLRVRDKEDGAVRAVQVEAGVTTLKDVEILRGIEANDEVVLPGA